jgi:hypothetical protein
MGALVIVPGAHISALDRVLDAVIVLVARFRVSGVVTAGRIIGVAPRTCVQTSTDPSSLLKSAPADAGQGGKRQESAVYTGVNEHFEPFFNAERRRPSVFQQTASGKRVLNK